MMFMGVVETECIPSLQQMVKGIVIYGKHQCEKYA